MNLHHIVRNLISFVHPDENCTLYQSNGQTNVKGKVSTTYTIKNVRCNVQPTPTTLQHLEKTSQSGDNLNFYMYSDETLPVGGISRLPVARTGDFIYRNRNQQWYLVTMVNDWSPDGWCNVEGALQVTPPDLTEVQNA